MAHRAFVRTCYRSLLRWSRAAEKIPFSVKKDHLKLVSPDMADAKVTIHDATTFRNVVRWSFRTNLALEEAEGKETLIRAVLALKLLNTTYSKQLAETENKRQEHAKLEGINFSIGQVVRHKRDGYRGVIYGWDRVCRHPQYITDTDIDFVQPFYSIIPDENDAIRSFGGPRMLQYVAQEKLQPLDEPFKITNRHVLLHFESYSPKLGRYIPKPQLRYEYPDEYCQEDVQPCEGAECAVKKDERIEKERPCRRKAPRKKSNKHAARWPKNSSPQENTPLVKPKVEGTDKAT